LITELLIIYMVYRLVHLLEAKFGNLEFVRTVSVAVQMLFKCLTGVVGIDGKLAIQKRIKLTLVFSLLSKFSVFQKFYID